MYACFRRTRTVPLRSRYELDKHTKTKLTRRNRLVWADYKFYLMTNRFAIDIKMKLNSNRLLCVFFALKSILNSIFNIIH